MMAIRGILLDVDGTLVLSNDAQARAWVEAFKTHGHDVPMEKVRPLIGMGGDKVVPELAPGLNDKDGVGKEIADTRKELMLTTFGLPLTSAPGARAFVERAAGGPDARGGQLGEQRGTGDAAAAVPATCVSV